MVKGDGWSEKRERETENGKKRQNINENNGKLKDIPPVRSCFLKDKHANPCVKNDMFILHIKTKDEIMVMEGDSKR